MRTLKIAIDGREAYRDRRTGKGQWSRRVTKELAQRPGVALMVISDAERSPDAPESVTWLHVPGGGLRWHWNVTRALRRRPEFDIYLSPTSFIVPALVGGRFPVIPVVHDLIAFRGEPHNRKAQWIERPTLGRAVRHVPRVFAISDSTRVDLLARYPDLDPSKVITVSAGPQWDAVEPNVSDRKTIFCMGTLCPRKNQLRLIQAYAQLPHDLRLRTQLVLAGGRGWGDQEIVDLAQSTPGVTWLGYISDERYAELLSTCATFAFPSLYEGFGLPVLDALQRGACVLTSDRGSLKEVAGNAAVMVDPESVESIRDGLVKILTDEKLRGRLQQAGPIQAAQFTWEKAVDGMMACLTDLNP